MGSEPTIIDTRMHSHAGITGTFLVRGDKTALIETGPQSAVANVIEGLRGAGVESLDWIAVTHIHLDHAGAAGTLAREFPESTVAVHEIGAPHLVEPSKLWSSAARIYGDDMERLWGGIEPLPKERLRVLEDGDKIDLGGRSLQAVETPGHARHHHAYLDDTTGIVFTGDALGVRLPDVGVPRPATPPPEFDLDDAIASIERIRGLGASALWLTHFGPSDEGARPRDVADMCDAGIAALRQWAEWVTSARVTTRDLDEAAAIVKRTATVLIEDGLDQAALERMEDTTSYRMNTWGYMRYLDKRDAAS
jgi:glyoxylase-like metal-dependent hydrolase (beta-lactamase superfamily II)